MNSTLIIGLSFLVGALCWGAPRIMSNIQQMGLRIFWVSLIVLLMISTKVPPPYNLIFMGSLAGAAVFENLYHRYRIKSAARAAARASLERSKKEARRERRKKEKSTEQENI